MHPTDPAAAAEVLARVARPHLRAVFAADSCVASTRIGLDVLAALGVAARPLPVRMATANAAHLRTAAGAAPDGGEWVVDVGARPPGHVVIGVPAAGLLVDLAADQADRPGRGIHIPGPLVVPAAADFFTTPGAQAGVGLPGGGAVAYRRERARHYTSSPNWTRRVGAGGEGGRLYADTTASILADVRDRLPAG